MLNKLILFLVRKKLKIPKYTPFKFTNQKSNAIYHFSSTGLMKVDAVGVYKSGVSLNWLLDKDCEIVKL